MAPMSAFFPIIASAAAPNWDTTGSYVIDMEYLGPTYSHDMVLTQDGLGNLTGSGGHPAGGPHTYTWVIDPTSNVDADAIYITAHYTASADAVTPLTTLLINGTIAPDGTMSGTWSDNYQGGARAGTWESTSGNAMEIEEPAPESVKVTIVKYVDGSVATATSGQNMDFPMSSTWNADNIGEGSGTYTLSETGFNNPNPYYATTADMTPGADYSTYEMTDTSVVGLSCDEETENTYMLTGYSTGNTLAEAAAATPSMTVPAFVDLAGDKFVIVWNTTCGSVGDGEIGGDVVQDNGVLNVDSIEVVDSTATADNTFEGGWKYIFHITAPTNEPNLAMKFSDWLSGANIIPVANNMRVSSAQASNPGPITLTAANTYSTPPFIMTGDLNAGTAGRQVQVVVEVKIPVGSASGSYTTTYGVQSTP